MAYCLLSEQTWRCAKMVTQVAMHERKLAAQRIGKKRFARAVWADNAPMLVALKIPGRVREDQALREPEGCIPQREERARAMRLGSHSGIWRSSNSSLRRAAMAWGIP